MIEIEEIRNKVIEKNQWKCSTTLEIMSHLVNWNLNERNHAEQTQRDQEIEKMKQNLGKIVEM